MPLPASRLPVPDLVSTIVGDTRRAENWTSRALQHATLDARVKYEAVALSRLYLFVTPQIAVDFEPAPHVGKMYVEAKRRWCHTQHIVYVPIFLRERLTESQLRDRLAEERRALDDSVKTAREDAVLKGKKPAAAPRGWTISDPEVQTLIEQETLARVEAEVKGGFVLRGATKLRRMERIRKDVEAEFLTRIRDGRVGYQLRYHQSALAAGG